MTIEQKAREIAFEAKKKFLTEIDVRDDDPTSIAARLGIIEGLEIAMKVAEDSDCFPEEGAHIAATIRALIEEQK